MVLGGLAWELKQTGLGGFPGSVSFQRSLTSWQSCGPLLKAGSVAVETVRNGLDQSRAKGDP